MSDFDQNILKQMFEAMGNSGGRFVIGQVIGSQTNNYGVDYADKLSNAVASAYVVGTSPGCIGNSCLCASKS